MIYLLLIAILGAVVFLYVKLTNLISQEFALSEIKTKNLIKENFAYMAKKTQADIDALTEKLEAGNARVEDALVNEAAEIKAAIESNNIDTTKLEAAIDRSNNLEQSVKDLFTADAPAGGNTGGGEDELPTEELPVETPDEPQPSEPLPDSPSEDLVDASDVDASGELDDENTDN